MKKLTGLGDHNALINVHLANKPPIAIYENRRSLKPCTAGEIKTIGENAGNHWRKIFNVYSKLLFALDAGQWGMHNSWQALRDECLLQDGSNTALIWITKEKEMDGFLNARSKQHGLTLVMGKKFSDSLGLSNKLEWLDQDLALLETHNLMVCPYFDYRQLSNAKIEKLAGIIKDLKIPNL